MEALESCRWAIHKLAAWSLELVADALLRMPHLFTQQALQQGQIQLRKRITVQRPPRCCPQSLCNIDT